MTVSDDAIWNLSRATFKDSDFDNGFPILWYHFGFFGALKQFAVGWFVALYLCYDYGHGFAPYMAFLFLNATVNLKNRRGDYTDER